MWVVRLCFVLIVCCFAFADVEASIDSLRNRQRAKNVVDTSALLTVNRILLVGNKITRDFIVLRELSIHAGDTVRSQKLTASIDKDKIKLLNTRLFNTVSIKILNYNNGSVDLFIELTERWYTFPIPIIELADRNFNEWWQNYDHDFRRLKYGINLYQYNFRGRNETLKLNLKLGFTNLVRLSYRIPYLDKKRKQGLVFDVSYDERKNIAFRTFENKLEFGKDERTLRVSRQAAITYTYRNSFYHFHGVTLELNSSHISDSLVLLNDVYFGNETVRKQRYTSLQYQYIFENRDFISYPLRGSYLRAGIRQVGLLPTDDVVKTTVDFEYSRFLDLSKNFYLSNNTVSHVSFQNNIPYANYSALGYNKQFIRGYELYLIEGPQHLFNKATLRKKVYSKTFKQKLISVEQFEEIPLTIYLKTYADVGYVWNYPGYVNGERLTDKLLTGVGGGVDFVFSYDASLRLEYSLTGEKESGLFIHIRREF
jgi:outer membrane protein assembly factor BamA